MKYHLQRVIYDFVRIKFAMKFMNFRESGIGLDFDRSDSTKDHSLLNTLLYYWPKLHTSKNHTSNLLKFFNHQPSLWVILTTDLSQGFQGFFGGWVTSINHFMKTIFIDANHSGFITKGLQLFHFGF